MKEITKNSVIERNPDMLASAIDDELVLLSVSNSKYYGMDDIGTEIWNKLDKATKVEDIVEQILAEYDIQKTKLENDIIEYLKELSKNNIIKVK